MSLKTVLLMIYYTLKSASPAAMTAVVGLPILAVLVALTFSPTAALVALAAVAMVFAAVVVAVGRFMERFLNLRPEPVLDYGPGIDLAAVGSMAEWLRDNGFEPVGLYRMDQSVLEVMVREDLKVYGEIHCGAPGLRPYLEFGSFYEGQRGYHVTDMNIKSEWFYPENIVNDNFPGLEPGELLDVFLRKRPPRGLLETPPEKFTEFYEMELRLTREHLLKGTSKNSPVL